MEVLKHNVMEVVDKINKDWVDCIRTAENNKAPIDLASMFEKFSNNIKTLDTYFRDAMIRTGHIKGDKKKGFFQVIEMQCKHEFKIFNDTNLKGSGILSFYCSKCLQLRKIKKEYGDDKHE